MPPECDSTYGLINMLPEYKKQRHAYQGPERSQVGGLLGGPSIHQGVVDLRRLAAVVDMAWLYSICRKLSFVFYFEEAPGDAQKHCGLVDNLQSLPLLPENNADVRRGDVFHLQNATSPPRIPIRSEPISIGSLPSVGTHKALEGESQHGQSR